MLRIPLPDMSGPPVWWDLGVLLLLAVGAAAVVRHRVVRP